MRSGDWSFWIDVGGTFTDCLARGPDGTIRTCKLLSSGVIPGAVGAGSTRRSIVDPLRRRDPNRFYEGQSHDGARYRVIIPPADSPMTSIAVRHFDAQTGTLTLEDALPFDPAPGMRYELVSGEHAPVTGIRLLLHKRLDEPIGPVSVRLGTTRGTNALLERQGARTALVTTAGFGDVLRIGYQHRPRLFDLHIRKPADLYEAVVELPERLDAAGRVLVPLDPETVREQLAPLRRAGITALAVCLLHAYCNPDHETRVARVAEELGFEQVSVSSRLAPSQRIIPRGDTTVVDAYLTPVIRHYFDEIRAAVPEASIQVMTSAGGLADAASFVGKDSILSGPAGGVVGCARAARLAGLERVIGFDMGGTSTDVSRFDGRFERRYEMEFADTTSEVGASEVGVRVVAPMLAIETVAAGGGSVCWFDGALPRVGPRSAGADPGPACYGKGGPLTVTDVNVYLGKILPENFPFPLDTEAVASRLDALRAALASAGSSYTREQLAAGFTHIANVNMAAAVKKISIARGYDPRTYGLVTFGGAGAQHACAIARQLGITTVLLNPYAGVLSAYGIGMADVRKFGSRHVGRRMDATAMRALAPVFKQLSDELRDAVLADGVAPEHLRPPRRSLDLRYAGSTHAITVAEPDDGDYERAFRTAFKRLFGFDRDRPVEIVNARVDVTGETPKPEPIPRPARFRRPEPMRTVRTYFDGAYRDTAVHDRDALQPGDAIVGPAIILESTATIVVEPGWRAAVTELSDILLTDCDPTRAGATLGSEVDLITLELFNNHFASIAERMGATLQKTALSTNVKERLDFSCALFTAGGDLVVNAPHIPVHLGAMSQCVKQLIAAIDAMRPGEVYVTNDPFRGGSHLPDVTVITPVFAPGESRILFFTASRAHHAEIGGITPGSMPPGASNLAEEGVLIQAMRLVADEASRDAALRERLSSGRYPSRSIEENIADIHAQAAANRVGVTELLAMVDRFGFDVVEAYMNHIQRAAETQVRLALGRLPAGRHAYRDALDNGAEIAVTVTITHAPGDGRRMGDAIIDFTGTDAVQPNNLNANPAIVASAVLYCLRCLVDEEIPLNGGMLAPVTLIVPEGCLLNPPAHDDPAKCAAVSGGNVETSQRVVDVIFGALGVVAASQGTMNNLVFGQGGRDAGFGYYETIGGGAGAGPTFDGADAVHTHMTNTRLTDPEVLEARYPVRLERFAIRKGSGGAGAFRGGDGILRSLRFLAPMEVSLLTGRRTRGPYGVDGGEDGEPGCNRLQRAGSQTVETLGASVTLHVEPDDVLTIETPGGGGFGRRA